MQSLLYQVLIYMLSYKSLATRITIHRVIDLLSELFSFSCPIFGFKFH